MDRKNFSAALRNNERIKVIVNIKDDCIELLSIADELGYTWPTSQRASSYTPYMLTTTYLYFNDEDDRQIHYGKTRENFALSECKEYKIESDMVMQ